MKGIIFIMNYVLFNTLAGNKNLEQETESLREFFDGEIIKKTYNPLITKPSWQR